MEEPLVSICCITYNHEHYIKEAFDGFIMQKTNFPVEIVISDDCSKDNTREIIAEYKAKYPDLIRDVSPDKNLGSSVNFIYVQQCSQGKYIAMCEGDDYWTDPFKLQKQVDFLETHPYFSMCFHGATIKNETNTQVITTCDKIETKEYFTNDIFPGWVIPTASVVFQRAMIDTYPSLKHEEWMKYGDIVLFLKCTHTGQVWGMSEKMSVYRMTENGAVVRQKNENDYYLRLCKHYEFLMLNFPQLDHSWPNRFIAKHYYSQMRKSKKLREQLDAFFEIICHDPMYLFVKLRDKFQRHS